MSFSRAETNSSHYLNSGSDIFNLPPNTHPSFIGKVPIGAYIGEMDPEETKYNRYLSPSSKYVIPPNTGEDTKLFSGFPRSYIMGGGAEHLFDDIVALAEMMEADGVDTRRPISLPMPCTLGSYSVGTNLSEQSRSSSVLLGWTAILQQLLP
jgi:acetyl esterase/lipase